MHAIADQIAALWRMRMLVWVMTKREVASRHAGTALGVFWPYAQPLLTVAAYYLVFDVVFAMRLGEQAPTRAVGAFLIVGALPWMAFCDGLSRGMNSLIEAGSVLQKNPLPPVIFPVRAVLASAIIFGPLIVLVALLYTPLHQFKPPIIALPALLLAQIAMVTIMGYLLAILAAALRDTVQIVGFMLSVGIYLSPVLFPVSMFPEAWRWVLWANPMTAPIMGYQAILLQGAWPAVDVWLALASWTALAFAALCVVARRSQDQLLDWL